MKTRVEVSPEKLRGGFYTPPPLVDHALGRLATVTDGSTALRILEPSVGDGAFLTGLASRDVTVKEVIGVEINESEAAKARECLARTGLDGEVLCASTLEWGLEQTEPFDAVVGNLPFVRFQ